MIKGFKLNQLKSVLETLKCRIETIENEISDDVIYIEGTAYDRSLSRSYYCT